MQHPVSAISKDAPALFTLDVFRCCGAWCLPPNRAGAHSPRPFTPEASRRSPSSNRPQGTVPRVRMPVITSGREFFDGLRI